MNIPPQAIQAMQARYTGQPLNAPPVPPSVQAPKNDQEAVQLVQQTKAMIDASGGLQNASPAIQAHIKAVVSALETYAQNNPKSVVAQKLMGAIKSDPNLAPYL